MQAIGTSDKRLNSRKVFYSEISATNPRLGKAVKLLSINYSNSGIALVSFVPIKVGEIFDLEFTLADNNESSKHKLSAEVVQSHNVSEIYVLGLQFEQELNQAGQSLAS